MLVVVGFVVVVGFGIAVGLGLGATIHSRTLTQRVDGVVAGK